MIMISIFKIKRIKKMRNQIKYEAIRQIETVWISKRIICTKEILSDKIKNSILKRKSVQILQLSCLCQQTPKQ